MKALTKVFGPGFGLYDPRVLEDLRDRMRESRESRLTEAVQTRLLMQRNRPPRQRTRP